MPRPSLQPTVLGESLFIDRPSEHRILSRRSGRTAIAAAYFDGIARYLARRSYGLRYEVLEAPTTVSAGSETSVTVRLTNTGHVTSTSWRLLARVAIPDGLRPGQSVEVRLPGIPMPREGGKWLLKLDIKVPGSRLSKHGVVGPQLKVKTVEP
jgi:hypothetical protein